MLKTVITGQVTLPNISQHTSGTASYYTQEYTTTVIDGPPSIGEVNSELQESLLDK